MSTEFRELIEKGHAIVRLENDHQQQISIQRPRDEKLVLSQVLQELRLAPAFAVKSFYRIPRKKKDSDTGKIETVWIEGISIGGAMAIARRWRNAANGARVVDEGPEKIICEGVLMDYEANVKFSRYVAVPRHYKEAKSNKVVPYRADLLMTAIAAGMSKAVRNAVLHAVPAFITLQYLAEAKRLALVEGPKPATDSTKEPSAVSPSAKPAAEKPLKDRFIELISGYQALGVTTEQIAKYCQKGASDASWTEDDYLNLLGLLNAIEEGTVKKESVFQPEDTADAFREPGDEESVTLEALMQNNPQQPSKTKKAK